MSYTTAGAEEVIDAREWLPPEPMERTLAALERMPIGGAVVLLLYREPFPLYAWLDGHAFRRHTTLRADGTFIICMEHA